MRIWFDKNDIVHNSFCSEQLIITPFLSSQYITKHPSFVDIDDYKMNISNIIKNSRIQDCDYLVYPNKYSIGDNFAKYVQLSHDNNKPLLTFFNDDNSMPTTSIKNMIIFRTSILKSQQKTHEHVMPAWSIDFKKYGDIPIRDKQIKPVVGFCGYINHSETDIRKQCINYLQKGKTIDTNFIIRQQFWGGKIDNIQLRSEYYKNIIDSDFILCARGSGNFSYRFYETLSMGRIPIFIDSDSVIPFEKMIDFTNLFPIIKEDNISNLENIIINFWENIKNYVELQRNLRQLYEEYYSPLGFIGQLDRMSLLIK